MKILVVNGPNLNMIGKRDLKIYGSLTLNEINRKLVKLAKSEGFVLDFFQSNSEGALIDFLQKEAGGARGILLNPGALAHYGYSLRDALADTKLPIVEVHLSDIRRRESFRKINVLKDVTIDTVIGKKGKSCLIGLGKLIDHLKKEL